MESMDRKNHMPSRSKDAVEPKEMGELPLKLLGLRKKAKHATTTVHLPPLPPQKRSTKESIKEDSRLLETTIALELRKLDNTSSFKKKLSSTADLNRSIPSALESIKLPPKPIVVKHGTVSFLI